MRPAQGIKHYDNTNIDWVTNHARMKAKEHYGDKILDIEAAMLSNHCSAVRELQEQKRKAIENKKFPDNLFSTPTKNRKDASVPLQWIRKKDGQ